MWITLIPLVALGGTLRAWGSGGARVCLGKRQTAREVDTQDVG